MHVRPGGKSENVEQILKLDDMQKALKNHMVEFGLYPLQHF